MLILQKIKINNFKICLFFFPPVEKMKYKMNAKNKIYKTNHWKQEDLSPVYTYIPLTVL